MAAARREKYKAELRADILAAAREIFVRDGYEAFTIRKLAKQIGFSPGNIYLYFKDKNAIFDSLVDESFADLLAALPQPDNTKPDDPVMLLRRSLRIYVKFGLDHPNHYRFSFLLQPTAQPRPHKQRAAYESLLRKVRLCIEAKRFKTKDAELAAQALWAAAHGITSLLIDRPGFPWVDRSRLIDQVLDSAVDGMLR
ncbi:MAG TPA: TetR/AcrR family transcriptional regulator [Terriglobales bacterium]|nr:TetR/AcrR family transcriptional regulator [Terriglobales bacterium]